MTLLDWLVMSATLLGIVIYGIYRTRTVHTAESYLLGDRDLRWSTIGLSIMATQASAITFLSTPGQAYDAGMGFAQFYFGMPLAMILLSAFALPIYYRLKVYTAYEYLEGRFDLRARTFTAWLFLLQRGLAAGITIYAPSIILATILGWNLGATLLVMGGIVILYTVLGGTKAVSVTQKQQMIVILIGMALAGIFLVRDLPDQLAFSDALHVAGALDKLNLVDTKFDLSNRYNIWSGILAGLFLFLSYFGTDQSQVQRYLSGKSLTESRLGLLFNAAIKVPMQVLVLFVGVLVFVFFQFERPPVHFNQPNTYVLLADSAYTRVLTRYETVHEQKAEALSSWLSLRQNPAQTDAATASHETVKTLLQEENQLRQEVDRLILSYNAGRETKDEDYIFIYYVLNYLPIGMVGLLIAVIFSAAMSSSASELNALATTTVVDIYRRRLKTDGTDAHYLFASKAFTVVWGFVALAFAAMASLFDNLIEAVNIIGSLFYGSILGIFVVAFFMKWVGGRAVFYAAILAQIFVIVVYFLNYYGHIQFTYLWLNPLGCLICMLMAALFQALLGDEPRDHKLTAEIVRE